MQPLAGWASDLHISLSPEQQEQFEVYLALLLDWNERMNLTAVREPADIQLRHFFDSLTCSLATGDLNDRSLIDVGTGAGFPGIPLKILYPGMRLTLVESIAKKTAFLATVVAALGLKRRNAATTILTERAETVGRDPEHREQYDWAAARSVAELRVLVEYLLPLCRVGGHALAQKGPGAFEEAAAAEKAVAALGGGKPVFHQVELPEIRQARTLVVVEKIAATPERFPRRPGIPAKRPL